MDTGYENYTRPISQRKGTDIRGNSIDETIRRHMCSMIKEKRKMESSAKMEKSVERESKKT